METINFIEISSVIIKAFGMILLILVLFAGSVYCIIRWVHEEAFSGYSRNHRRRIIKEQNFFRRISLIYLYKLTDNPRGKRRIVLYWLYLLLLAILCVASFLYVCGVTDNKTMLFLLYFLKSIDIISWIIGNKDKK